METFMLKLARASIVERFTHQLEVDLEDQVKQHPELLEQRATFITLIKDGELRGCIGSIIPHRSMADDIMHNAKAAAFSDPRFAPISEEEIAGIKIEVSLLSVPMELEYTNTADLRSKVRIGQDGVILNLNGNQATFLPQVWEQLPDFESFFAHLCRKAGLEGECLEQHPEIRIYQVDKIKES